jgi:hypothetical protein
MWKLELACGLPPCKENRLDTAKKILSGPDTTEPSGRSLLRAHKNNPRSADTPPKTALCFDLV